MSLAVPTPQRITGATRLLVIVGDPIAQAKSPLQFNARLASAGADAVLVPWHAPAADFETVFRGVLSTRNVDGIVVTYPFKAMAAAYCARLDCMAERTGAVNALRRERDGTWSGAMFDGLGCVRAAEELVGTIRNRRVLLIGAGGAGAAIAHAIADGGAKALHILELDRQKEAALLNALRSHYPGCTVSGDRPDLRTIDLVINATPVGLSVQDGLPVPLDELSEKTSVFDIVPRADTALIRFATERGARTLSGQAMVAGQTDLILGYFGLA